MKIGFVVPRYGVDVIGGAEYAARLLAERLVMVGHSCEVFTTCALDAATWANELAPGTTNEQGVRVHRFESNAGRGSAFAQCSAVVLGAPRRARPDDAMRWVEQLGPICPDAVDAAAESSCDVVTFHPYMYHPTVTGIPQLGRRSVLHPAAHDEPAIHLPVYRDVFRDAAGLAFWTGVEQRTASRIFPSSVVTPQLVVGIGVEPRPAGVTPFDARARAGIGERPYLLCLGKALRAKGSNALADAFLAYKRRNPGDLALLYAGPVIDPLPTDPDIIALGPIDEDLKWALLRDTRALVSPSALESLSLVLLEAWSVASPVLVNAACDVTRDHCEQSGGGLWFDSYGMFEATVARLEHDANLRAALGAAGRDYVERKYTWSQVIDRYIAFLQRVARRAAA